MEKKIKETETQFADAIKFQEYIIEKAKGTTPVSAIVGTEGALKCIFGALITSNSATLAQCEKAVKAVMDDVLTYTHEVAERKEAELCKE